jgi:uncharacterized protein (DUF302 family)
MKIIPDPLWALFCAGLGFAALGVAAAHAGDNLVKKRSRYSVPETIDRIEKAVTAKGMKIFARIDHGDEAKKAGLVMRPTQLLIFGNPKGGTSLMVAKPTSAIDLPMKALAWEDKDGTVWLTYNAPGLLEERHGMSPELTSPLGGVGKLLEHAVE